MSQDPVTSAALLCGCGDPVIPGWSICTDCEGEAWAERRGPIVPDPAVDWSKWRFVTDAE